ncbi:MAG: response regulator, partial [Nannocystaceae bacterium]|nr:response regulator [Nannocystaceae bacterium]
MSAGPNKREAAQRILVLEDDPALGDKIAGRLRSAGFEVELWREGRRLGPQDIPKVDLVILDLMLPGAHGIDVLRDLRSHSEVPVLVLSARNDTQEKVRALRLGADD